MKHSVVCFLGIWYFLVCIASIHILVHYIFYVYSTLYIYSAPYAHYRRCSQGPGPGEGWRAAPPGQEEGALPGSVGEGRGLPGLA